MVEDIYNQLFWYGFDPADTTSPADKTMFGGTKGKFNGLAFLDNTLDPKPPSMVMMEEKRRAADSPTRRKNNRQRRRDDYYYDGDLEEDGYVDDDYLEEETFSDTLDRLSQTNELARPARRRSNFSYDEDNDDDAMGNDFNGKPGPSLNKRFDLRGNDVVDNFDNYESRSNDKIYFHTPPNDQPRIRMDTTDDKASGGTSAKRRKKRRPRRSPWEGEGSGSSYYNRRSFGDEEDDDDSLQWASKKVSNWFRDDEDEFEIESESRGLFGGMGKQRRPGRRRRSEQTSWVSPFEVVGTFFGLDNEDISYQAEMYNRQMGLGPQRQNIGRARSSSYRPERRGRGYAYHYDVDTSEYDTIVDADVIETEDTEIKNQPSAGTKEVDAGASVADDTSKNVTVESKTIVKDMQRKPSKKTNWEERALAMERIPPPDIPAWGPSGDLGMDARMKATIDALQDIQEAQSRLEQKKKREQQAADDITILRV